MTEQLIKLVRKYAFLYDTSSQNYKNVGLKDETWKKIGNELNENDEVLKKKWKNLRDNYLRYKKEINGTTGQATKKYQKWPWASQLQFLDKTLAPRQTTSNITTDIPLEIQIHELTYPSLITSPQASTSFLNVEKSDDPELYTRIDSTLPAPKKFKTKSKERNDQPVGIDKVIGYLENKKKHTYDSVDYLFLSYAGTFKKFSERNQIKVKLELAKLFSEIELKELDERGPSSSISLHTSMSNYSTDSDFPQPKSNAFQNVMSSENCSTGKKKKKNKSQNKEEKINVEENQDKINHGNWAEAKMLSQISGPVALEFGSQTYVTAMDNGLFTLGPPHDEGDGPLPEEILVAIAVSETKVSFKSGYGKYLGVEKDGTIVGRSDAIGPLEQFEPIFQDNKLAILASTGCFLSIRDEDDSLVAKSSTVGANELVKVRLNAIEDIEEETNKLDEKKGNIKDIEKNYVKMFQKFQDKKMRMIEGKHGQLKKAQQEGKLHESLLDRRAKTKADRYCK